MIDASFHAAPLAATRRGSGRLPAIALVLCLWLIPRPCRAACLHPSASGAWTLRSRKGVAWLVDPCGGDFFSIGVNTVTDRTESPLVWSAKRRAWVTTREAPAPWALGAAARLRRWGFNTAGAFSSSNLPMPVIPDLDLGRWARFQWADPFDPSMKQSMERQARNGVASYRGNAYRIGYFTDNEIGWWNGALFSFYLKQRATNRTRQALVALIRRHYHDDWRRFTDDFVPSAGISSFADLQRTDGARAHLRPGGNGIAVVREWTGVIARRYYELVSDALRKADPAALIFSDRLPSYYDPDAVRAMAPYVDAVATNYDVDSPDGWIAHYYFDGLSRLTGGKPVLVSEWYFAARQNRSGNRDNGHLMIVETQDERARGAAGATRSFARIPGVVGLHWFQYFDEPGGGRAKDHEDYNFGLVDTHGRPYEKLVAALSAANRRVAELHRQAKPRVLAADARGWANPRRRARSATPWSTPIRIPAADIDSGVLRLARWPKDQALVNGLSAPSPEVAFGDFFLAWSPRGLHLATISMDHYDAHLLEFAGEFPRSEAFRIDVGVDAGAGPRRFAIYFIPPKGFHRGGGMTMGVEVCRMENSTCRPAPSAATAYQVSDRPRISAQVTLPWELLGVSAPAAGAHLRVALAATAFYRSRWMSLGGAPPAKTMEDAAHWKAATLASSAAGTSAAN